MTLYIRTIYKPFKTNKMSISIKTQNKRGNEPKYKENLGYITTFLEGNALITVDNYERAGDSYKKRDNPEITIAEDGLIFFKGTFAQLKIQLSKKQTQTIDLFEQYDKQPSKLKAICDKWSDKQANEGLSYEDCKSFLKEVEAIGYTFDYELSAEPFNLRLK